MNRAYWIFPILLVIAIGIGWAITSQGDAGNTTPENGNDPTGENRSAGDPIYYYFYSDTCPSCRTMERETLSNATVIEALKADFDYIKVNTAKERQLSQMYNIVYVPTNVFAYPDGQEIGRFVGAAGPEDFLDVLDQVLEFYAQNG